MDVIDHNKEVNEKENVIVEDMAKKKFVRRYRSTNELEYDVCEACFSKKID